MAWVRPTLQQIIDRIERDMESRLTGNVALLRYALLRVLARVFAGAMHIAYGYVEEMSKQIMVDTADAEYLDRHAFVWGVVRKAASFASGYVLFTGTDGEVIPAETVVRTIDGVEYVTTVDVTIINGVAQVPAQAVEAGILGNLSIASVLSLVAAIPLVDSDCYAGLIALVYDNKVGGIFGPGNTILNTTTAGEAIVVSDNGTDTMLIALKSGEFRNNDSFNNGLGVSADVNGTPAVTYPMSGGQDAESDDDLRVRILQRIQQPPAGGSMADYVRWATEIVSTNGTVDAAWCLPATPSPGWVTVVIKAAGSDPVPSAGLIADVLAYINELKPVTADVQVVGVVKVIVDMDMDITATQNTTAMQAAITTNLSDLFSSEMVPGDPILISQVRNAISSAGVSDYLINSITTTPALTPPADPNQNLNFTGYQYGIIGTITFHDL